MKKELASKYDHKSVEKGKYQHWLEKEYFKAGDVSKKPYAIVIPPPNVTGKLHLGHAWDTTLQDMIIRYKRMQGYDALWLPGMDHAGIATQAKVEARMREEGISRYDLGREGFLEKAWSWKEEYASIIRAQWEKLGLSLDYSKERFTLDEGMSDAVLEEFINLYKQGYIYKGTRMVNWCPNCHTAISDAEVEYKEEVSHLWHLRYKIKGENRYVEVATTRPETMLGDTAVAVNPEDKRYTDIVGKTCIVPIVNREIPIIADEFVETEFGTGCVKITPAHDPNDYQAGLKHKLEFIEVFDDKTIMGDLMPEVKGMKAIEARKIIVKKLEELGALVSIEDYTHNVGKCERCKTTIEPRISEQWFVKMKELAKPAIEAVKKDDVKFVPKRYEKTYFNWMENIQDWCISRQLWWGHQIPAYYCEECGHINVAKSAPNKCEKCGSDKLHQDPDTLDTWFSSALWPFSTLGWPNKESEDLKTFYPTNVLVTGYDIIFFWVARMIFSGLYAMGEKPFSDVLIHGIVRDSQGRKMSKTLGNGVDPIEVINQYGADSLRFSVLSGTTMGNDIRYMPEKLEQASNFANKIWNAAKFIIMNRPSEEEILKFKKENYDKERHIYKEGSLKLSDEWILNKLNKLILEITNNIENYDLGVALDKIYNFMWNEFCDWYIEMAKVRLYGEDEKEKVQVSYVLNEVFTNCLKLLHPFMPFITSEIYDNLVSYEDKELMVSSWPTIDLSEDNLSFKYDKQEETIEKIKEIIVEIRNIRNTKNIHPTKKSELILVTEKYEKELKEAEGVLLKLGFANKAKIQKDKTGIPEDAIKILTDGIELYMPLEGLVNLEEERKRLEVEKLRLEGEVARCEKMLSNPGFVNKAPEAKVKEEKEKLEKYKKMLEKVMESLK